MFEPMVWQKLVCQDTELRATPLRLVRLAVKSWVEQSPVKIERYQWEDFGTKRPERPCPYKKPVR